MCGICGLFSFQNQNAIDSLSWTQSVRRMTSLLAKRGPDDEGFWSQPGAGVYFGFRRLAILDLTQAGHQPMVAGNDRAAIIFNGEIYNFQELRHELAQLGVQFRSRSDTEVLLEALCHWGVEALPKLNGMFAFAWYDLAEKTMILARDHAGIKPLYYFIQPQNQGIAFGSQYNVLLHTPWQTPGAIREDVLHLYLRLHHIPPPYGLLENTYQLEPGHYMQVRADGRISKQAWWQLPRNPEPNLTGKPAVAALAEVLDTAVRRQRIADVPLGVFLSGGVDSPLVTAVARQQTGPNLKAFTIGNPGWVQDESEDARRYSQHLDVDFRLHDISGEDAAQLITEVIAAQHEPFGDYSIIPALLISQFAREEVTVALSGDGGDELFFGYERPRSLMRNGSDFRWPWLMRLGLFGAGKYGIGSQRSSVIVSKTPGHYYFDVNSRLKKDDLSYISPELDELPPDFALYDFEGGYQSERHLLNYSRYVEFYGQLQRGLKKVDMASMHNSLEVRVPLLDKELLVLSLRIDPFDCLRNGQRKALLFDLLGCHVPPAVIPQSKRGFAVPLDEWLRGSLRPLVEETLFQQELYPSGLFDRTGLQQYWQDFLAGNGKAKWGLWTILSLQWWAKAHLV